MIGVNSFGMTPFQNQYIAGVAATNVAINPGPNAALPPIASAMYAPIIAVNKLNPTLAACIAYHIALPS